MSPVSVPVQTVLAALDAIWAVGKRQAVPNTRLWNAMVRECEGIEGSIIKSDAMMGWPCEMFPLGTIRVEV